MAQGKKDNLEQFAKRVATRIRKASGDTDSMERLICRLLTSDDNPQVAARMASEWVAWRYGKPAQPVTGKDGGALQFQWMNDSVARPARVGHS
jgi:hypothetical protein